MRKCLNWGGLLAAALLAITVTGCPKEKPATGGDTGATTSSGGKAPGTAGKMKIAVIPKGTAHSFWQTVKLGADTAGKEEGVEIVWQGPQKEGDITDQINVLQNQVNSGVNGVVIAATDATGLVKDVKAAMLKVPVVTIDSGLTDKDASLCLIATDNVEGGRKAAETLAKLIGEKGAVGLMPFQHGSASSDDRENGFMEGIKKYPNIKVVSTLYTSSEVTKAVDQTNAMLTAHPEIVGIFAANEPNGVGAAQVLKTRNAVGKVKLVAYDSSKEEIDAIKSGAIQATIVQDPYQMGYKGVKTVVAAIKKQPITEKFINSGMTIVTKDNMESPEVQKLINPPLPK